MPERFAQDLRAAMQDRDMSTRALSRRLAELKGRSPETERRELNRYLAGEKVPEEKSLSYIREALEVDARGLPTPAPRRASASRLVTDLQERLDQGVRLVPAQATLLEEVADGVRVLAEAWTMISPDVLERLERLEELLSNLEANSLALRRDGRS